MVTFVVGFLNKILIPVFINGSVKSTASALFDVIVKSTIAMSALPSIISPEKVFNQNFYNKIFKCVQTLS